MRVPSGVIARLRPPLGVTAAVPDDAIVMREMLGGAVRVCRAVRTYDVRATTAMIATTDVTTAITQGRRTGCRSTTAVPAGVGDAPLRASSISIRASAMSCNRRFGSLLRHRSSNRVTRAGVAAGSARQSGSLENSGDGVRDRVAGECRAARQHLVEHAAEGPETRALVDRLPTRLLGAHLGRRPQNHPVTRATEREGW